MSETVVLPKLKIVFMGTPDFAAIIAQRLAGWEGGNMVAVYCREDKPARRGQRLTPPPVKDAAESLGIPVYQPKNFASAEDREALAALAPDVLVVAAYGLILPQAVLDIPKFGALNVHASLLPRYRGAAPIHRAIMNGESSTGITIMRMEAGLDTGPILSQRALGIGIDDTAGILHDELADLGARLMLEVLGHIRAGEPPAAIPQNDALATYAAKIEKSDGFINWHAQAEAVHARIRGVTPWPGAQAVLELPGRDAVSVILSPGAIGDPVRVDTPCGSICGIVGGKLAIACADRFYLVPELRVSGKKSMPAQAFWNGYGPKDKNAPAGMARPPQHA